MTYELCFPPQKLVIKQVGALLLETTSCSVPNLNTFLLKQLGKLLKNTGATHVFVASDDNHMVDAFQKKFKNVSKS